MADTNQERVSPVSSEVGVGINEENQVNLGIRDAPRYESSSGKKVLWNTFRIIFLTKAPLEGAPLEYGGHRVLEIPSKYGIIGVLSKYLRFFGPGMIITVAFIDPDNFQSSIQDGQQFGYKLQNMVIISLLIACYLQVSDLSLLKIVN